jgi:hypothetical protein
MWSAKKRSERKFDEILGAVEPERPGCANVDELGQRDPYRKKARLQLSCSAERVGRHRANEHENHLQHPPIVAFRQGAVNLQPSASDCGERQAGRDDRAVMGTASLLSSPNCSSSVTIPRMSASDLSLRL